MLAACATVTYVAIYDAAAPPSKRLVTGRVVKLRAGLISAHVLGTKVSFWNGYGYALGFQADKNKFVIGDHPRGLQQRGKSDFAVGVSGIKLSLKLAVKHLENARGVYVLSVDKGEIFDHPGVPYPRLNGHPAHLYRLLLSQPMGRKVFGIPAWSFSGRTQPSWPIGGQMGARARRVDVVLVGAGGKTFLVRFGNDTENLDSPNGVLMSLRFHTHP
jgi:hypothetical protein